MAKKVFLTNIDLNTNELQNAILQPLATAPTGVTGRIYFDTAFGKIGYYNGSSWIYGDTLTFPDSGIYDWTRTGDAISLSIANATTSTQGLMSAADKTTLTNATASATNSTLVLRDSAGAIAVTTLATTNGTVGMNATNGTDIVNLQTLQSYLNTGTKYKEPVRVAVSTNVTLSGTQTLDGVACVADDRVLLYGQTTASQNGLWLVKSGAWVRPSDFTAGYNASGVHVIVTEGTANQDNIFLCTTDTAIVGTNNLAFNRLPNSIQVDNTTIELASGVLQVKDAGISAAKIASNAVTTAKILDANVTTDKILDANVTTAKIADGNVTAVKLASDAVTTVKILDSNVTTAKIADANVTTVKILDANVTAAKLASGVADGTTITGGAGTALSVQGYTRVSGTTVARKWVSTSTAIGSGTGVVFTHNLGTRDVVCSVRDASTYEVYEVVDVASSTNAVTLTAMGSSVNVIVTVIG